MYYADSIYTPEFVYRNHPLKRIDPKEGDYVCSFDQYKCITSFGPSAWHSFLNNIVKTWLKNGTYKRFIMDF